MSGSSPASTPMAANRRHATRAPIAVGAEQRFKAASSPHLPLAKRPIDVTPVNRSASFDLGQEVTSAC